MGTTLQDSSANANIFHIQTNNIHSDNLTVPNEKLYVNHISMYLGFEGICVLTQQISLACVSKLGVFAHPIQAHT